MSAPARCDQCDSATIQGVFCHEIGCPNRTKVWDADEERWVNAVDLDDEGDELE